MWLSDLSEEDLKDHANPTGKIQTQIFQIKYNVSIAASKFPKDPGN